MLHQTWHISSSSSPSPYSSSASSLCKPFLSSSSSSSPSSPSTSSQVPNTAAATPTTHMEPFKTVFLQQQQQQPVFLQQQQQQQAAAAMGGEGVFVGERGNNTLFGGAAGDGFSVEELLDLREFSDQLETPHDRRELEREKLRAREVKRESSDSSSGVTFDLPPPPSVIDLPAHVAEELEWVSMMMDDSLSEVPASSTVLPPVVPVKKEPCEAKLRPTLCALSTECLVPVKARRSKRSRAAFWSLSGSDNNSSSSSSTTSSCSSSSYLFYDSPFVTAAEAPAFLLDDSVDPPTKKQKPRKRGRKPKAKVVNHSSTGTVYQYHLVGGSERRCSHCGVSKTPQWRAGPEGAKTLCNACGVRYKSGRLLPEYRPACSPTFVSELHSNSHRKVLEMRRKKESTLVEVSAPAVASF